MAESGLIDTGVLEQGAGGEAGDGPPAWLPAKFWDGEAKAPRVQDLAKSYASLESTIGKRIHELPEPARRSLIEAVPDAVKDEWGKVLREQLAADEEFVKPLVEARLPKAPETYEVKRDGLPEGLEIADDDPLLLAVQGWAREAGVSQEKFDALIGAYVKVAAEQAAAMRSVEDVRKEIGPDFDRRSQAVATKVAAVAGKDEARELLAAIATPAQFRALERLVRSGQDPSLPTADAPAPGMTREQLGALMSQPDYWHKMRNDPEFRRQVDEAHDRLYADGT